MLANKDYDRGCDRIESAGKKKGRQRSDLLFEAVAELHKSLRVDYGYAPAHERLGTALRQLGFDSNAVYEYNLALQLQPSMQEALDGLASEGFPR
jgi:Flp pilus assembly protein TadD